MLPLGPFSNAPVKRAACSVTGGFSTTTSTGEACIAARPSRSSTHPVTGKLNPEGGVGNGWKSGYSVGSPARSDGRAHAGVGRKRHTLPVLHALPQPSVVALRSPFVN